jgi:hypothetical protein
VSYRSALRSSGETLDVALGHEDDSLAARAQQHGSCRELPDVLFGITPMASVMASWP